MSCSALNIPQVVAKFAYWNDPYEEIPASAAYEVMESNMQEFAIGSHISGEQLMSAGIGLPFTPTYQTWVKMGRVNYSRWYHRLVDA